MVHYPGRSDRDIKEQRRLTAEGPDRPQNSQSMLAAEYETLEYPTMVHSTVRWKAEGW